MAEPRHPSFIRPYGDHIDDGLTQVAFTLPIAHGPVARTAAVELAHRMGLERAEIVHQQRLLVGYTYFVLYGRCRHRVDVTSVSGSAAVEYMTQRETEAFAAERIGRTIVVIGASTGTDTHSVGIDAVLNLKGYHGHHGLEGYAGFEVINLGSQVPNRVLLARASEHRADAILVSQTVTQQDLHLKNLTELVELLEAEGDREQTVLVCGGPRISDELAKELGYDAGFSKGTYPHHVATFLVREIAARIRAGSAEHAPAPRD
ncbi:MAG TPA: OAM dimerization domain-containing protein [Streptosporangiaceae bacterium]|nr:OAM dimerization domain-containing protein [Streptosporangiaceae bacterium]